MSEVIKIIVQPIVQEVRITTSPGFAVTPAQVATWNGKQDALGYTPEDAANKDTDETLAADSDEKYASQKAVKAYADAIRTFFGDILTPEQVAAWNAKQNALGFTPEDVANKDTDPTLAANSDEN